ncbi:hypothetical protein M9Y10_029387 [Tritrichomonas musculus]|uniref:Guanylate cyclase domain-containing protein n=1 Tax=Tritrichomonas musculus TaxID=1915356 RepID=A0ABR2KM03_9EUKA
MHSPYSTSFTITNTIGSTRGFVSFSSNSVFSQQRGPSNTEKFKSNILHLSINVHRYTGIDNIWHNFAMIFRLLQTFCIYLLPRCRIFWQMNKSTNFFIYILELPLHLCFVPGNENFHSYFLMILFLFFFISLIFIFFLILRNPAEYSISNSVIFYISLFCSVLTPILSTFVFTLYGYCLNNLVFQHNNHTEIIAAIVLGSFAVILSLISHYFSYYIKEGTSLIDFSSLFVPWAPYTGLYAHFNTYILILGFLGEFLPVEEKYYQIGFSIFALIGANPGVILYLFYNPIFQDLNDTIYWSTFLTVNMISIILMNIRFLSDNLTPVILFVVVIISLVVFFLIYNFIMRRITMKYSKKLFSVYKHTKPYLPATTPLVFTAPMPSQVLLSRDAYSVMQSFSSLGITTVREFHYYIFVGSYMKMPAIKNLDFIKWGLNYFHDNKTLLISTQICQYFKDNSQTQAVLIQKLNETDDLSIFMTPIVFNLVLYHADVISDKPAFLKKLYKKANGGLVRSRRALAIFWGCVLKHSTNQMAESLCKLRDTISETRTHFDELIRCYPFSLDAIGLYLNFMTEICGEYNKCNRYINKMSAKFIEMKSDAIENEESVDGISLLLNDHTRHFSPYIQKLTQYLDQENQARENTNGPVISIWTLSIISSLTLIICILVIMILTLVSFNEYPQILSIVNSADDVFIELASLIIGARRICLFASGVLEPENENELDDFDSSVYDNPGVLLPWIIDRSERLPSLILRFYKSMTNDLEILRVITGHIRKLEIFGSEVEGKLTYIIDMMAMSIRNIAVNIPYYFDIFEIKETEQTRQSIQKMIKDQKKRPLYKYSFGRAYPNEKRKHPHLLENNNNINHEGISNYTNICNSSEMRLLLRNIEAASALCDDFIFEFQKISKRKVDSLTRLLYYSMIFFPICYIFVFGLVLLINCLSIKKEANFRLTLFLSLPEQVASEIYNSDSFAIVSKIKNDDNSSNKSNDEGDTPENDQIKEKTLRIESLHQFSSKSNLITGIGIKEYLISSSTFILIAAFSMFILTYYSKSVNETFQSRSYMLCSSALRYSSVSYSSMFLEESFFTSQVALFNESEIIRLSDKFLTRAQTYHRYLTQGSDSIIYDFREYQGIEDLILNDVKMTISNLSGIFTIGYSHALLQHNAYSSDSFDTVMRLFIATSFGMLETYKNNTHYYQLNGNTWYHYNHLIVSHLLSDLENATGIYLQGVSQVIYRSFMITLIVSIVAIVVLLLIFIGPILSSSKAISQYFSTCVRCLCQVPPEVFTRSFYINKWLKGQISRSNYGQYETTFTRNISREFQSKIISESSEKILVFTSNGEYIETPSYDVSQLKEKNLQNILNLVLNTNDQTVFDEIQRAFDRFQEAKDKIDNIRIICKLNDDQSVKITVTGIQLSHLSSSITSFQRYYSYILILLSDFTEEAEIEAKYKFEKEKTLRLLNQIVPDEFAIRIHDGENNISFSATIGSALTISIVNYDTCLDNTNLSLTSEIIVKIRKAVNETLSEFNNVSLLLISGGDLLFIAGLFNEEQNGRTEAIDTIQFAMKLNQLICDILDSYNLDMFLKFGICTGGPIFCRLIRNNSIASFTSGEPVSLSKILRDKCEKGQLIFERTTYECCSDLELNVKQAGEFEYQGKSNPYYSIPLDKNIQIVNDI